MSGKKSFFNNLRNHLLRKRNFGSFNQRLTESSLSTSFSSFKQLTEEHLHATPRKISPEIRVFISSTFRDMQAERDHLLKKVFPELRQLCRKRNVVFTEIDLRWGVTEEEAKQGKVTRICLDEVDRCRPYFIGILGNRYGSSLNLQTIESDPDLLQKYPWMEQALVAECSLTEIEIIHAALMNPSVANCTFFYFCEDRGLTAQFDDVNASKLAFLKERIRQSGLPVRIYSTPESLGQQVWEDWQYVINQTYPDEPIPTPLDQERKAHEAFASTHYRFYIENAENLKRLDEHMTNDEPLLVISGESGIGKSALLANWSDRYRRENPNAFVITHYMGAVATGSNHLSLLRRVMEEIRDHYHLTDELPRTSKELEREFPQWLARVRRDKLVLIIDALNQVEESAQNLSWLPARFPSQVRIIISTLEGRVLNNLRKRKYPELNVKSLTLTQREQLISNYLALYTKKLSFRQSKRLAGHTKCDNPLFLKTVLEELRVFGYFEQLNNRIDYYLSATDLDDLFQRILERMEQDYGNHLLREVMTLIWAARQGLLETELLDLIGCTRIELSRLLIALDYHLMHGEGLLNFFHDYLQRAVFYRYLADSSENTLLHQRLAAYFETLPMSERRVEELPWQLKQADNREKLKSCVSDISMFLALSTEAKIFELLGYWLTLKERYNLLKTYQESLTHYEAQAPSAKDLANLLNQLGRFIELNGDYEAAEGFYYRALTIQEQVLGTENLGTVASLHNLAKLLHTKGDYDKAETFYRRAQDILTVALGADHPAAITGLSNLAILLSEKGDYAGASALYQRALTTREKLGIDSAAAASLNNLAVFLCKKGNYEEAESNFQKALDIWRQVLGVDHPAVTTGLNNMAALLDYKGNYKESGHLYTQAAVIRENMLGKEHPATARIFHNQALLLEHTNYIAEAETYYQRAYSIFQKTLGLRHPSTVLCKSNLDRLLNRQNEHTDINRADIKTYQRPILALLEETLGTEHSDSTLRIESIIASPINIYTSRLKLLVLLLMSGFFTSVCLFLFASPPNDSFYELIRYFFLFFFPAFFFFNLNKFISSKPTITISREGIWDNSSFLSLGLIKWEEIQGIQIFDLNTTVLSKYIGIYPKDVKEILSRCNPLKGFIVIGYTKFIKLFYKFDYPIIAITDLSLPASVENLLWQISKYFNELEPVENINLRQSISSVKPREPKIIEKVRKESNNWRIPVPIDVPSDDWNAVLKNCRINGIAGMTLNDINAELSRGGKFVIFQYCIIIFKQPSSIYFIKGDDKALIKGLRFTLISLFLGWWGLTLIGGRIPFPRGLIHSAKSCLTNCRGGKDVTQEVIYTLSQPATFTTKGVNLLNFYTLESFQGTGDEIIWSGFSIAFITYVLGKTFDVSESILMPVIGISFGVPLFTVAIFKIGRFFRVPFIITALMLLFVYVYGALFYLADLLHFIYPHLEKTLVFLILFNLFTFALYIAKWLTKWLFLRLTKISNHVFPDGIPNKLNIASQVTKIVLISLAVVVSARLSWSAATSIHKERVIYIINQGDDHLRLNEYDLALADFNRAIKIDFRSARAYTSRGVLYQVLKDYKKALVDFHLAIQLDPNYVWAINARGETYALLGRYKDALTDYNRAIQLQSNDIPALAGRGQIYASMDNYNAALKDFNQAIQLAPDNVWLLVSRGVIYRRMGYYDQALADFNRAITLNPDYIYAIESRAETYLLMRRSSDAEQDRNKLTLLSQAAPIALRGETYLYMGRYDEGLREFNRAIVIYPNYAWAIAQRGKTYQSLEQYDKALADLNRAIELYPNYAWAIAQRGATYCKMKRYQEALADFNYAVKLEPKLSSIQIEQKFCDISH